MIFRRKRLDRPSSPIESAASNDVALPRRRLVTCWRPDGSGLLVTYWKVVEERGEPAG
ncbi:hypothetical protein [Acidiphilium acidophilum]|jgi:hypothetical protein|uniref:hypothetical protein n=1 Tax=Acidiphilium acidophilum TaxID=76588 RepID=UPI0026BDFB85|nr:hypothetical protein [Acidiphilium acidophilum]